MPIAPVCPTCPPGPIPEPYPVESARKTVIVEAGDNVTVEKFDGLLDTVYKVSSTEVNDGMLSITVGENDPVEFGANEPGDVSVEIPLADEETFGLVKITDDIETEDPDAVITAVAVRERLKSVGGYKEVPRGPDGKPDVPMEDRSPNYIYLTEVPGSQGPDHYDEWIWKPGDPSAEPPTEGEWKCIGTTGGDTTDLVHKVTGGTEGNLGSLTDDGSLADSGLAGTDVEDAVVKKHEHANKAILDEVTAPYTTEEQGKLGGIEAGAQVNDIASISVNGDAVTPDVNKNVDITVHTHGNKAVLDEITAPYTTEEQGKLAGIEAGAQVNTVGSISLNGDSLTPDANKNVEITVHTHDNKAVLDEITAPYTTEEQGKLEGIEAGAQVNTVGSISVNGGAVAPDANKNVNIVIPKAVPDPSAANQVLFSVAGANGYEWSVATWEMEEFPGTLPEHCVLLDYFSDGYRYGKQASESIFTSIESALPSDFGIQSSDTFKQSVPFARFDGESVAIGLPYDISDVVDANTGFTVEFYLRAGNGGGAYSNTMGIKTGNVVPKIVLYGETGAQYDYTVGSHWYHGSLTAINKNYLVSTPWQSAWHHVAITVKRISGAGDAFQIYVDGNVANDHGPQIFDTYNKTDSYNIYMYPCMNNNNAGMKQGYYDIAQLAVWDYPKYYSVETYELPTKFFIDE